VLRDFSEAMIDRARQRLAAFGSRVSYHLADLPDPSWPGSLDGRFGAVTSCLANHNRGEPVLMARVYAGISSLTRPGGRFPDLRRPARLAARRASPTPAASTANSRRPLLCGVRG
jgi:Methyltransferase domain